MDSVFKQYSDFVATSVVPEVAPIVVDRASQSRIIDKAGREYLDCLTAIAVASVGHQHPAVVRAVAAQLEQFGHVGSLFYHVPVVGKLAELLAGIAPGSLRKTFFANSGAEGIEAAIRMAKAFTGRTEFIALTHSFHGRTNAALSVTGNQGRKRRGGPYLPGTSFAPAPYTYRNPFGTSDPEQVAIRCAELLEWTIKYHTAGDVAAFIVEPVLGEGGIIVPPANYLKYAKEVLDRHDILLIADEVQSGLGRTGAMFAVEHFGVVPDILVLAKGIANGLPLSATIARAEIADALGVGEHHSTFGGNPLSCAAAVATIEVLEREGLPEEASRKGEVALSRLRGLAEQRPCMGDVRGLGLMIGVELVEPGTEQTPAPGWARQVTDRCREKGLLIGVGGVFGNVLRIQPPLVIADSELTWALDVFEDALSQVVAT